MASPDGLASAAGSHVHTGHNGNNWSLNVEIIFIFIHGVQLPGPLLLKFKVTS